jgi:hypothetical protein
MSIFALPKRKTVLSIGGEKEFFLNAGYRRRKMSLKKYFETNFAVRYQTPTFALPYRKGVVAKAAGSS